MIVFSVTGSTSQRLRGFFAPTFGGVASACSASILGAAGSAAAARYGAAWSRLPHDATPVHLKPPLSTPWASC